MSGSVESNDREHRGIRLLAWVLVGLYLVMSLTGLAF